MGYPKNIGIVDTMIGFAHQDFKYYDFLRAQLKDSSTKFDFPVEYMFKGVPKELYGTSDDPVSITLNHMDKYGVEIGVITLGSESADKALKNHPDRFKAMGSVDPNEGMDAIRKMVRQSETYDLTSFTVFPCGCNPQVGIGDPKMYPVYAKCIELGVPIFVNAGVPGPRVPMWPQRVEYIDQVMYDFPELVFVIRHGAEPWEDLAVKLMVKWPNLYYSTSAFAPKHYPKAIIDYANTRGADKVIFGGYFPMGLSLERIMSDMENVPFREKVWPKFLRENAMRVLKLSDK